MQSIKTIFLLLLLISLSIKSESRKGRGRKKPNGKGSRKGLLLARKTIQSLKRHKQAIRMMKLNLEDIGDECIYMMYGENLAFIKERSHVQEKVCGSLFKVTVLDRKPYSGPKVRQFFENILKHCCGSTEPDIQVRNAKSLPSVFSQKPDFIFPVFAYTNTRIVYGHYFVPLLDPPGAYYVTIKREPRWKDMLERSAEDVLPIMLLGISMAIVAGFLIWLSETWSNDAEYQRPFVKGWSDGIWWSFVSMTTVGYGDKTPKSVAGRIISIIWILIGIAIFSIISGKLTTVILLSGTIEERNMAGEKVGGLHNRMYDKGLVTRHGGNYKAKPMKGDNGEATELQQMYWMISQLRSGYIDGFLLDKFTYWSLERDAIEIAHNSRHYEDCEDTVVPFDFFLHETSRTDIPHSGDDVSYGVLIRNETQWKYLEPVIKGNKLFMQTSISESSRSSVTNKSDKPKILKKLKDTNVLYVFIVIAIILCAGILVEFYWKRKKYYDSANGVEVSAWKMTRGGKKTLNSSF